MVGASVDCPLDDATLVHLKCVGRRASEVVAAAARASGPCVRWPGEWWVPEDQRGVWKCLTQADLVRLPRIRLKMNTEWLFRCRCELVRFLNLASRLYFRDRIVLNAVIFHGADLVVHRVPASKGREYQQVCDGYDLASEWVTVPMTAAVFQFRIVLSDETPREEEPTMALRVHVMPLGAGLDLGRDMVEVRALCPADFAVLLQAQSVPAAGCVGQYLRCGKLGFPPGAAQLGIDLSACTVVARPRCNLAEAERLTPRRAMRGAC